MQEFDENQLLWVEKYRPSRIDECILPESIRQTAKGFVSSGNVPHLLLSGSHGTGKTTLARALCDEMGYSMLFINASEEGRKIDTLRTSIRQFATSMSLTGARKAVILDEADYLPADTVQPALRGVMEEYAKNCVFILTCNLPHRIIPPLHSRCTQIEFQFTDSEKMRMQAEMWKRSVEILNHEGVEADQKVVAKMVDKHFPDFRKTIQEFQRYSVSGKIDSGIFVSLSDESMDALYACLRDKDFAGMREWVAKTPQIDMPSICRDLYERAYDRVEKESIPQMVLTLADYQYRDAFVADHEINLAAMFTQLMLDVEFKT